jgi:hypothetical protein
VQLDKAYVDTANAVNERTIGIYALDNQLVTGESWYNGSTDGSVYRIQTLRKMFNFSTTATITHGISITNPSQFTRCFGSYTDGSGAYGLIWGSNTAIAGQISFNVSSTQIVFETGSGAPTVSSGRVILEYLANP